VNSLPETITGQRHDCDLNLGPSAPESSTLTNPFVCLSVTSWCCRPAVWLNKVLKMGWFVAVRDHPRSSVECIRLLIQF